jgi:hypothetical protein
MSENEWDPEGKAPSELSPLGLDVMVQCEGFRCLAHRTIDGKWRAAFGDSELENVIRFFPY